MNKDGHNLLLHLGYAWFVLRVSLNKLKVPEERYKEIYKEIVCSWHVPYQAYSSLHTVSFMHV
jgi:hypothetical protein